MHSPQGWEEPGQTPEFDEFTLVLKGVLRVKYKGGEMDVPAGQAVIAHRGEWVNIPRPGKVKPNTSPCACLHSRWRRCTGTREAVGPLFLSVAPRVVDS